MLWTRKSCDPGAVLAASVGSLRLWVRRCADGFEVAGQPGGDGPSEPLHPAADAPADLDWARYVVSRETQSVQLQPALPDRPVIVRLLTPIRLLPGQTTRVEVTIPLWVRVEAVGPQTLTLCEFPSRVLSRSWYGAVEDEQGSVCYALVSRDAVCEGGAGRHAESVGICPIVLRNETTEVEVLQRFCLDAPSMRVFALPDGHLTTDEVRILIRPLLLHRRSATGEHHLPSPEARLVSPPRVAPFVGHTGLSLSGLTRKGR